MRKNSTNPSPDDSIIPPPTFGRRRVRPRVCVADAKPHARLFLGEMLEACGFLVESCGNTEEMPRALQATIPDLVVLGFSAGGIEAARTLEALAAENFTGRVLPVGPAHAPAVSAVCDLGKQLDLAMLPLLTTPFSDQSLRASVAPLIPADPAPDKAPVDVGEALAAGWLELWYQPKIDIPTLTLAGAEALVRMRHPAWGVVLPSRLIPARKDPHFRAFSRFVIQRAIDDWQGFLTRGGAVHLSVNLPPDYFEAPGAVEEFSRQLPAHPAFRGFKVEFDASEIIDRLDFVNDVARQLRFHNVSATIDNLGSTLPAFMALETLYFSEIKIASAFTAGCADNPLKRSVCRQIVEFAASHGARTVATGLEAWPDLMAARDLGIDQAQGFLFAKPMTAPQFARDILGRISFSPQHSAPVMR